MNPKLSSIEMPHNPDLEKMVLSAILNSTDAANSLLFSLTDADFDSSQGKALFKEIKAFYARYASLDMALFTNHLKIEGTIDSCGGLGEILFLHQSYQSSYDFNSYIAELKNLSHLRSLIYVAKDIISQSIEVSARADLVQEEVFKKLFSLSGIGSDITHHSKEILDKFSEQGSYELEMQWRLDRVRRGLTPYTGIASGYPTLDKCLGFFRNGCIYYVGARTSMGKTTFILNLIRNMLLAREPFPIAFFSLEMRSTLLTEKLLCMFADIKHSDCEDGKLTPEQVERSFEAARQMRMHNLLIEDQEALTIAKLRARARRLVKNEGAKIIFIDYLTCIQSNTKYQSKHLQVDEVSKNLQSMAKELNVPVICLAQLNRASMNREGSIPTLADFRESGSIEEDCDGAILLHRPDYYSPTDRPGKIEVIVAKNRIRGQLRKIAFTKNPHSELYFEYADDGEYVRQHFESKKQYKNPFAEDED